MPNYDKLINDISKEEGVNPDLTRFIISETSRGDSSAVSGDRLGLMHVPRGVGLAPSESLMNPADNIRHGVKTVKQLAGQFTPEMAVAAYIGGLGALTNDRKALSASGEEIASRLRSISSPANDEQTIEESKPSPAVDIDNIYSRLTSGLKLRKLNMLSKSNADLEDSIQLIHRSKGGRNGLTTGIK